MAIFRQIDMILLGKILKNYLCKRFEGGLWYSSLIKFMNNNSSLHYHTSPFQFHVICPTVKHEYSTIHITALECPALKVYSNILYACAAALGLLNLN